MSARLIGVADAGRPRSEPGTDTFSELVGRERQLAQARECLATGTHSVVFVGPRSSGVSSMLRMSRAMIPAPHRTSFLVVDDLSADPDLATTIEGVRTGRHLLLGAISDTAVSSGRFDALLRLSGLTVIELARLGREDVAEAIRQRLGNQPDDASVDRVLDSTTGLAAVVDLIAKVTVDRSCWGPLPGGLWSLCENLPVDHRLDAWAEQAVGSTPVDLIDDLAACGPIPLVDDQAFQQAIQATCVRLVNDGPTRVAQLDPPALGEVIRGRWTSAELTQRRARWAEHVARVGGVSSDDPDLRRVTALIVAARGPRDHRERAVLAAEIERCLEQDSVQARHLTLARLEHETSAQAALDASLALEHGGRPAETLALARKAAELAADDDQRAVAIDRQASALVRLNRRDEATEVLRAGLQTMADESAALRLQVALVNRMLHNGHLREVRELVDPFIHLDPVPVEAALIASISSVALGRAQSGLQIAHSWVRTSQGDTGFLAEPLLDAAQAVAALELGRSDDVNIHTRSLRAEATRIRSRPLAGWASVIEGWQALATGNVAGAIGAFQSATAGFTDVGEPVYLAWSTAGLAAGLALAGHLDRASAAAVEHEKLQMPGDALFAPEAERAIGVFEMLNGDASGAARRLDRAIGAAVSSGQYSQVLGLALDRALLTAAAGELIDLPAPGLSIIEAVENAAAQVEGRLASARVNAWRLLNAHDDGQWLAVIGDLAANGAIVSALRLGAVWRRRSRNERDRRRANLHCAALAARTNGLSQWVENLETPNLGPRNRQVAGLAARGLRRTEIADQLFIARRTVDRHLNMAFGQLGVTSIGELAAALDDLDAISEPSPVDPQLQDMAFRGRESDVAAIVGAAAQGEPGVSIVGPPGIGRSRLIAQCAVALEAAGWCVVHVDGVGRLADEVLSVEGRRFALIVDDIDLIDASIVESLASRLPVDQAFILTTSVTEPLAGLTRYDLAALDDQVVAALAAQALGAPLEPQTEVNVIRTVAGNPLALKLGLRAWLGSGDLRLRDGCWALGQVMPSVEMRSIARSQISLLSDPLRRVVTFLAVASFVPARLLERLVDTSAVNEALTSGLIRRVGDGELTLAHDLHRVAVAEELDVEEHRRLFVQLDRGAELLGDVAPGRRVAWSIAAGVRVTTDQLVEGTIGALHRSDFPLARRLVEEAIRRGAGSAVQLLRADIAFCEGRPDRADAILCEVATGSGRIEDRVTAAVLRSDYALWEQGDVAAAEAVLRVSEDALVNAEPACRPLVEQQNLIALVAHRAVAVSESSEMTTAVAHAGRLLMAGRPVEASRVCAEALDEDRVNDPRRLLAATLRSLQVECLIEAGWCDAAEQTLDVWRKDDERSAIPAFGRPLSALARLGVRRGAVSTTIRAATAALFAPGVVVGGQSWLWLHSCLAVAFALGGDAAAAQGHLERSENVAVVGPSLEVWRQRAVAWTLVARGRADHAASLLREHGDRYRASGLFTPAALLLHDALRLDPDPQAATRLGELCSSMEGDLARARRNHAIALLDGGGVPLLAAAEDLASAGDPLAAAEVAAKASATFRRNGLGRAARQADRRHRAWRAECDGAAMPGLFASIGELTPRQRDVARLAARGDSNRDIAEALGISVRTVENLLHQTYLRLGLSGRASLVDSTFFDGRVGQVG